MTMPEMSGYNEPDKAKRQYLAMIISRVSGYELSVNTKIMILSCNYARHVRVQRTRQGQSIILSYDYSRLSGYGLSENTEIIILS